MQMYDIKEKGVCEMIIPYKRESYQHLSEQNQLLWCTGHQTVLLLQGKTKYIPDEHFVSITLFQQPFPSTNPCNRCFQLTTHYFDSNWKTAWL